MSESGSTTYGITPATTGKRVPALDGVRGLAIVLVLINNVYPNRPPLSAFDYNVAHLANCGWIGVDLFFVLSGFLITGILYDTKGGTHFFRTFYLRRILRIFPLYYGTLFCVYFVFPHFMHQEQQTKYLLSRQAPFEWTYFANLGYVLRGYPPFSTVQFWSLAVEEQFYFVWPFLVFFLTRKRLMTVCCAGLVLALALRIAWLTNGGTASAMYMLTPFHADGLAVGALIALVMRGPDGLKPLERWVGPVAAMCTPIAAVALYFDQFTLNPVRHGPLYAVCFTCVDLGFGALMVATLARPHGMLDRVFSSRTLGFLGRYSYAMYVFHGFVLWVFQRYVPWMASPPSVFGTRIPASIAVLLIVVICTVGLAFASWHLYEKQFLKLKRFVRYSRKVDPTRGAPGDTMDVPRASLSAP